MWGEGINIESLIINNDGYVRCNSCFYSALDTLSDDIKHNFYIGVNKLIGEIDSGVWAPSYLLSMYPFRQKDFVLFKEPEIIINNSTKITLNDFSRYVCYMDKIYPLFCNKKTIIKMVETGIKANNMAETPEQIRNIFHISPDRFNRKISCVGNEIFRVMAAIGYCYGKQVFCFPWLSKERFEGYHGHMLDLLDILQNLKKIVIIPMGE